MGTMIEAQFCNRIEPHWVHRTAGFLVLLFLLTATGCGNRESPAGDDELPIDRRTFGDPYQIVTNEMSALPDEPPYITSDTLSMLVSYTGGCMDHRFDFDFESERDTTRIWIHHRDGSDAYDEEVLERLEFALPDRALGSGTIVLLNPNDDAPFMVKWGPPAAARMPE